MQAARAIPLKDVPRATLEALCDAFRSEVLRKAGRMRSDGGSLQRVDGQQASDRECPRCNGRGEVKEIGYHDLREWWTCMRCCGTGRVQADASLRPIVRVSDGANHE